MGFAYRKLYLEDPWEDIVPWVFKDLFESSF